MPGWLQQAEQDNMKISKMTDATETQSLVSENYGWLLGLPEMVFIMYTDDLG